MKTIHKLKGLLLMMLTFMMSSNVLAQEVITSTFTDKNLTTEEGHEWQGGPADGYDDTKGAQFYKGNKDVVLTGVNNVVSVEVTYSTSSKVEGSFSAYVGEAQIGDAVTLIKSQTGIIQKFETTSPLMGDVRIAINLSKSSLYIKKIVVTKAGSGLYVPQPYFSKAEGTFTTPFDLTITADDDCTIKYTTDGSTPSITNGTIYEAPITINTTTTVKAIAIKDGVESSVTEATYNFIALDGNGSFEKPFSINDIQYLDADTEGWFIGTILGSYANGGNIAPTPVNTNWAVGTEEFFIPVQIPAGPLQNAVNAKDNDVIGKEVRFYGNKAEYFSNPNGVKNTSQVFGLYDLNITEAGYSTYYANHAFVVPTGVEIGIVTNASTANATLTIDWSAYKEGEIVPANTGVLLKGNEGTYSYIVDDSEAKTPAENLLKGSVAEATTEGENCLFYKLSYDNNGENLGFYWAAENGAAFTNGAHKAYLALPTEIAKNTRGFGLEGDGTTGIDQIANGQALVNVYTIDGILVRKQVLENQALNGLKKGIYIVNGKKVIK